MAAIGERAPLGALLRDWRRRRRLSQLDLALEAGVSARHLSFLETGRSKPSREMVLHLAEELDVPLRDRNQLLLAAGFAPAYAERTLDAPEMAPVREALDLVLTRPRAVPRAGRRPLVEPRRRQRQRGDADQRRRAGAARAAGQRPAAEPAPRRARPADRQPRRVARPPAGPPAPRGRADRPTRSSRSSRRSWRPTRPASRSTCTRPGRSPSRCGCAPTTRELRFFSTVATFGTAVDVTLAELSIEAFFPADAVTAEALRALPGT